MSKLTANTAALPPKVRRPFYQDLTFQVVAGMVLGVLLGALAPDIGKQLKPLGDIFIA